MAPKKIPLVATTLYVRVRPIAKTGGHAAGGESTHHLKGWTDESVTMLDSSRTTHVFSYPTRVIVPEATQQESYDTMLPPLIDAWMNKENNLMILAYGQTGTGKTHTMLGSQESLQADVKHEDWGILPRVMDACFNQIKAKQGQVSYIVTLSALEFYLGICFDLLNHHIPIDIGADGSSLGMEMRVVEDLAGVYKFLADVKANRTTAATKMNTESSRSHCALLVSLFQLDHSTRSYTCTKFNLFDLAGSERADKTGEKRYSGTEAGMVLWEVMCKGKDITKVPIAVQAYAINMELTTLATEICNATDRFSQGMAYNPPRTLSTAFQRYTGAIMMGRTLLTTVICISPAPQHGSENLFSLKWGEKMAKLKAPNVPEKPVPAEKALEAAVELAAKTAKEMAERDPSNKYWACYEGRSVCAARLVQILERLIQSC